MKRTSLLSTTMDVLQALLFLILIPLCHTTTTSSTGAIPTKPGETDSCHPVNPCQNGGQCQRSTYQNFKCLCPGHWTGDVCSSFDPCRVCDLGRCEVKESDVVMQRPGKCSCFPGATGEMCSEDKDECLTGEGRCLNGGTCNNVMYEGFFCTCPKGTSGQYCEIDPNGNSFNPCTSNPCRNGGTCSGRQPWRVKCTCTPGWTGDLCERSTCFQEADFDDYNYEDALVDGDVVEYCLFGGECTIHSATTLPTCDCTPGQSGTRCMYKHTVVTKVTPVVGPQSGSTDISFHGYNLNGTRFPEVQLGNIYCPTKFANSTLIVCTTPRVTRDLLDVPLLISVQYIDKSMLTGLVTEHFTYRKDPTISSLHPLFTISSGGVAMNVTGTGLDVVGKPNLQITVVHKDVVIHVFESPCTINNPTQMVCCTPALEIFDSDGRIDFNAISPPTTEYPPYFGPPSRRRRRRALLGAMKKSSGVRLMETDEASWSSLSKLVGNLVLRHRRQADGSIVKVAEYKISNQTMEFYIGFRLDGVPTYRNLTEQLPAYAKMTVYTDPHIDHWTEEQEVRVGRNQLEVEGDRLLLGIQATDYTMLIGRTKCTRLDVFSNKLICAAPEKMPEAHTMDTVPGTFTVMVYIGVFKEPFKVGSVTYRISFWDNPTNKWGVISTCFVFGVIVIVIAAILVARKTNGVKFVGY